LSSYGRSKLAGEAALKALHGIVPTVILRPPVLYGPRDQEFLPLFQAIRWGLAPLLGAGKNELSVCYVEDVARAIGDLAEGPAISDEIFCLDDGSVQTWESLAKAVSEVMGKKALPLKIPKPLFQIGAAVSQTWANLRKKPAIFTLDKIREMEQPRWVCGYRRLKDKIGWSPKISLKEGMESTFQYYKQSNLL
jgi:nucleoside-diphosphate-sugar epimerase